LSAEGKGNYVVAVIGAGPAGLFAARQLASEGARVVLINRDIKPGGLAEYGIYPNKHKMKEGLRKQFRQILAMPGIEYYGNVAVGQKGDLSLADLRAMGIQAVLVTVGAQGTKWLGLPGEDLTGVYHAKDIVYHYNRLPPYSEQKFSIGQRVAIVGVGNVMMDIAHWLIREVKVDEVIAVARRGPAEVKFSKKEMEAVARNLDLEALEAEFIRVAPIMRAIGQNVEEAKEFILSTLPKAEEPVSDTRFRFDFLASPSRILGGERGVVRGLEVEDTTLIPSNGDTKAKRLGTKRVLDVDTVIFCIGDRVDENFGLSVRWNEFVKNPTPRFPVNGLCYEAYDQDRDRPLEQIFVAGWSREASSGLVGVARKDGENGAQAVLAYLNCITPPNDPEQILEAVRQRMLQLETRVVTGEDVARLEAIERTEAERLGLEEYKFSTNKEMLSVIESVVEQAETE
jgi:ferredoxin/flavodoxin---NADP+ reductase